MNFQNLGENKLFYNKINNVNNQICGKNPTCRYASVSCGVNDKFKDFFTRLTKPVESVHPTGLSS